MTAVKSPVRVGIAGCGNVLGAYLALAERLQREGLANVTAFCGRQQQRSETLKGWSGAVFETEFDALAARRDVDAIVILTPMREHASMARQGLRAGKHVLVEKPMAVTLEEGRCLMDLAVQSGAHLFCAPFTVLSPTFRAICARMRRGDIGRVVSARARYGWAGPDWADWFYKKGGGALFDLGVYSLTTLTGWLGPVRRVTAFVGTALPQRAVRGESVTVEADDNAQVLLDFGESRFAVVTTGFTLQQYRGSGIEVYGTEGTINLLGDDWDPDGYELWQNSAGCWQLFKETHPDWPWTDGLRHLVECIYHGTKPLVTPEHAFHVLEVMVKAQVASAEGRAQPIASTFIPPLFEMEPNSGLAHRIHDRTREG